MLLLSLWCAVALAGPRAVIVGEAHRDLGKVEPGAVQHLTFHLRNDGDASLMIEDVEPTCYCTSSKLDMWDVPPGKVATISVRIDPSDFVGNVRDIPLREHERRQRGQLTTQALQNPNESKGTTCANVGETMPPSPLERESDLGAHKISPVISAASGSLDDIEVNSEFFLTDERMVKRHRDSTENPSMLISAKRGEMKQARSGTPHLGVLQSLPSHHHRRHHHRTRRLVHHHVGGSRRKIKDHRFLQDSRRRRGDQRSNAL
jgi:hypothetical protein